MEEVRKKPFFRYDPAATIILTFLTFLVSQLIAVILIGIYPAIRNFTSAESLAWMENSVTGQFWFVLLAEVIAIAMVLQFLKWAGVKVQRIGLVPPKLFDIVSALITYGLYFITYLIVIIIAGKLLSGLDFDQEQQIGFESAFSSLDLFMTFASLVILPPLAEEFIFRGFLFSSLRTKYRFRTAVIITSILFGIVHLQFGSGAPLLWVAAIDTFILSCFLCFLRERYNSLWPPIFLHAIKNCVAFLILFGSRFI
jgi:membrane protease YdiL (CAAX protease family)